MKDHGSVDEIEIQFDEWKSQRLIISLKNFEGVTFIDCRKWLPLGSGDDLRPTRGILLNVQHWPKAIEAINEMLRRYNSNVKIPNR